MKALYKYITKEDCRNKALECNSLADFYKRFHLYHKKSKRENWFEEVTKHIPRKLSIIYRYVYMYVTTEKQIYIGITNDISRRFTEHSISTLNKFKTLPTFICNHKIYDLNVACNIEIELINFYRNLGWDVFNKHKGGGQGGSIIKWNKSKVLEEALKYKTRQEFIKGSKGAYRAACTMNILDKAYEHMIPTGKLISERNDKRTVYSKDKCIELAKQFTSVKEFNAAHSAGVLRIYRKGWADEIFKNLKRRKAPIKITEEELKVKISDCLYLKDVLYKHPELYNIVRKRYRHLVII